MVSTQESENKLGNSSHSTRCGSMRDTEKNPGESLNFEEVLKQLGSTGKFQIIQCILCFLPIWIVTFSNLGFVFTGYTPPHVCKTVNETELFARHDILNDTTAQVSYGQCDVTLSSNQSGRLRTVTTLKCPKGRRFPGGSQMTMVSEWDLVCEDTGLPEVAVLIASIGGIVGGLFMPVLADRFGRKPILCITAITAAFVDVSMVFSPNIYYVFFGYFVVGVMIYSIDATYLVLAMEMLLPNHRQVFGVIACLVWVACVLIIGLFAYLLEDAGWRFLQGAMAILEMTSVALPFFLCESPRWLAAKGRSRDALAILEKACRQNNMDFGEVKKAFEAYMKAVQKEHKDMTTAIVVKREFLDSPKAKITDSSEKIKTMLKRLFRRDTIAILLIIFYVWTTSNITYFGVYMTSSDLAGNRFLNFCLMTLVEIPCNFLIHVLMKRMGRLKVMRIFIGLAAVSFLLALALIFLATGFEYYNVVSILLFLLGKFAVTCFFNVLYIYTPEIFPTVIRSAGCGSCRCFSAIGLMLAPYSRPLHSVVKWGPSVIFFSMCLIAFLLTFCLPETKDTALTTDLSELGSWKRRSQEKGQSFVKGERGELE